MLWLRSHRGHTGRSAPQTKIGARLPLRFPCAATRQRFFCAAASSLAAAASRAAGPVMWLVEASFSSMLLVSLTQMTSETDLSAADLPTTNNHHPMHVSSGVEPLRCDKAHTLCGAVRARWLRRMRAAHRDAQLGCAAHRSAIGPSPRSPRAGLQRGLDQRFLERSAAPRSA